MVVTLVPQNQLSHRIRVVRTRESRRTTAVVIGDDDGVDSPPGPYNHEISTESDDKDTPADHE